MKPTHRMFQVFLVQDNQTLPSRCFPNEKQAQFYCDEFNRIVEQQRQSARHATYQPIEVRRRQNLNFQYN